jgi:hypothetical protein
VLDTKIFSQCYCWLFRSSGTSTDYISGFFTAIHCWCWSCFWVLIPFRRVLCCWSFRYRPLMYGFTNFTKTWTFSQNSIPQKSDIKQVPYWGPTNNKHQCAQFSIPGALDPVFYALCATKYLVWLPTNTTYFATCFVWGLICRAVSTGVTYSCAIRHYLGLSNI